MDEGTIWTWRWRCPDCGQILRGEGDRAAKDIAVREFEEHRGNEKRLAS